MVSEAVRSARLSFPPSCEPHIFSASPSARRSEGCATRAWRRRGCSKGPKRAPCSSGW